jgi:hypothetical protein
MCRVFLSHSEKDADFIEHLRRLLFLIDIDCNIAEYEPRAGAELWEKIQRMIEESYFVIVLLTNDGIESEWVQREITMAKTLKKKFVPIVDKIVKDSIPDPLKDKEFIPYDKDNILGTLERVVFQMRDYKKSDIGFATNC